MKLPGGMPAQEFLRDYWQKKPLVIRQAFPGFECPVSADELAGLACEEAVESRIVIENDNGKPWPIASLRVMSPEPANKFSPVLVLVSTVPMMSMLPLFDEVLSVIVDPKPRDTSLISPIDAGAVPPVVIPLFRVIESPLIVTVSINVTLLMSTTCVPPV